VLLLAKNSPNIREANGSHGHQRSVPSVWIKAVQEKWPYRHGKQQHQCKAYERQFGATADDRRITDEQRTMIEHLLRGELLIVGLLVRPPDAAR